MEWNTHKRLGTESVGAEPCFLLVAFLRGSEDTPEPRLVKGIIETFLL